VTDERDNDRPQNGPVDASAPDGSADPVADLAAEPTAASIPERAEQRSQAPRSPDASVPAIVATVALVVFSIFIGVYGPRLGNRQQVPGGTTLAELAGALSAKHSQEALGTIELLRDDPSDVAVLERDASNMLGVSVKLPTLPGRSVTWLRMTRIRVPGAAGVQVLLRIGPRFNADFASIFILRDEDRFTVFDIHGRPRALPEGEMFSVAVAGEVSGSVVNVFRTEDVVYSVQSGDREVAAELIAGLQSIAAARSPSEGPTEAPSRTPSRSRAE
jgi:hypothetical protein